MALTRYSAEMGFLWRTYHGFNFNF